MCIHLALSHRYRLDRASIFERPSLSCLPLRVKAVGESPGNHLWRHVRPHCLWLVYDRSSMRPTRLCSCGTPRPPISPPLALARNRPGAKLLRNETAEMLSLIHI